MPRGYSIPWILNSASWWHSSKLSNCYNHKHCEATDDSVGSVVPTFLRGSRAYAKLCKDWHENLPHIPPNIHMLDGRPNFVSWQNKFHSVSNLYRKLEPLLHRNALGFDFGSSERRKKAWYSTHIFQKALHASRLAMVNSRVSLHKAWGEEARWVMKIISITFYFPWESLWCND